MATSEILEEALVDPDREIRCGRDLALAYAAEAVPLFWKSNLTHCFQSDPRARINGSGYLLPSHLLFE
jgi:hypothetical protein